MAEAEEVIGDAARHAADWSWQWWKRLRGSDESPRLELADVGKRLELVLGALFGTRIPVRVANPAAPPSTLARIWRRSTPRLLGDIDAMPATDGRSVFLPVRVPAAPDAAAAFDDLMRMAVQQAMRSRRGTADHYPHEQPLAVRDLYLMSEIAATDRELARSLPGLQATLRAARRACVRLRPPLPTMPEPARTIETMYRELLTARLEASPAVIPAHVNPRASLQWATSRARELISPGRTYGGIARDSYLGDVLRREEIDSAVTRAADEPHELRRMRRVVALRRRPNVRRARADEDDAKSGLWMVQTSEPIEHVEDPMGLQRPTDREEDADPEGLGDSLSELGEARIVRTPQTAREVLLSDDPPRSQGTSASMANVNGATLLYPEWDCRRTAYRADAVAVHCFDAFEGSQAWVETVVMRRRTMLNQIRRRFQAIRARRSVIPQQPEGDELDLDAIVQAYAERCAGVASAGRFYQMHRPARRDVALMMLIDTSGSTDGWASANDRVIDVEKEALLIVSVALQELGMPYAIQAFSGNGPGAVTVRTVKRFDEHYDEGIGRRIAGLEPEEFTRTGAAVRHAVRVLVQRPAYRRLLLLLSDGKPNDVDEYEGRYGLEDTRQAIHEARSSSIDTFALTVDRVGARYLPLLFGPGRYQVLQRPEQLSTALVEWLRRAALSVQ